MQMMEIQSAADHANAEQLTRFGVSTADFFAMHGIVQPWDNSLLEKEFEAWEAASDEALINLEANME